MRARGSAIRWRPSSSALSAYVYPLSTLPAWPPFGFANTISVEQAITFVVGYILQDVKLSVYIALGGTALTFLAIIPPWPFFNKHPVKWLPVGGGGSSQNISIPQTIVVDEKAIR